MSRSLILALVVGSSFVAACEQKPSNESTKSDAGSRDDKYVTADSKLTKALQAAASAAPAADNGPPLAGVFAAGVADQRHARGLPSKIEWLGDGVEPRVSVGNEAGPGSLASVFGPALIEVSLQTGPRTALPTVDLVALLGGLKGTDGSVTGITADVKQALPAKDQIGQLSPEAEREIAAIAGTEVQMSVTPDGRESDAVFRLGKNTPPDLDRFGELAAQALVLATVPVPPKPVGVGAQWIAETRMAWSGIDVLAYRAFRVKSIDGNRLTVALDVKAYATDPATTLPGVPKGASLEQFDAQAQGEIEVVRGEPIARKLDVDQRMVLVFRAPSSEPGQGSAGTTPEGSAMTAQLGGQIRWVRGDDLRVAAGRRARESQ
jgi:hypothetical protein